MKVKTSGNVICFNFEKNKLLELNSICNKLGIKVREIPKDEYSKTVGELMGFQVQNDGNTRNCDFDEEMMVVYNLGSNLDKMLKKMREKEIEVPLKAMLTGTNQTWIPKDLMLELQEEHKQMNK